MFEERREDVARNDRERLHPKHVVVGLRHFGDVDALAGHLLAQPSSGNSLLANFHGAGIHVDRINGELLALHRGNHLRVGEVNAVTDADVEDGRPLRDLVQDSCDRQNSSRIG